MRIALGVEYLGTDFHGWQKQEGLATIQAQLERALSIIADHPVETYAAGRTDAGVHASGQVIHFDTDSFRNEPAWSFGVNTYLPDAIRVLWSKVVPDNFHARFSAHSRTYRYIIHNSPTRSAILAKQTTWHPVPLDVVLMQEAAQYLVGEHDFSSFRGSDCQANSPIKSLHYCKIFTQNNLIIIEVRANGFLHHMVRNIAGALLKVGEAKVKPVWIKEVLEAKDRRAAGKMLAPNGLYLIEIGYPQEYKLPGLLPGPLFLHIV